MPSYALDENFSVISACDADSRLSYRCLECKKELQKRSGRHRRPHFYHLRTSFQCRLYSKSIDHLVVQTSLKNLLPSAEIERPFPEILRIADLCWEEKKCVLEIQCSPIEVKEVRQRKDDYKREGYRLVWLLDDRLYNKRILRLSEEEIRASCSYYFSVSQQTVYDQFEVIHQGKRVYKGPPLRVDLSKPAFLEEKLYFSGDLTDSCQRYPDYARWIEEKRISGTPTTTLVQAFSQSSRKTASLFLERLVRNLEEN